MPRNPLRLRGVPGSIRAFLCGTWPELIAKVSLDLHLAVAAGWRRFYLRVISMLPCSRGPTKQPLKNIVSWTKTWKLVVGEPVSEVENFNAFVVLLRLSSASKEVFGVGVFNGEKRGHFAL